MKEKHITFETSERTSMGMNANNKHTKRQGVVVAEILRNNHTNYLVREYDTDDAYEIAPHQIKKFLTKI